MINQMLKTFERSNCLRKCETLPFALISFMTFDGFLTKPNQAVNGSVSGLIDVLPTYFLDLLELLTKWLPTKIQEDLLYF